MSRIALSCAMAWKERKWTLGNRRAHERSWWGKRYVDDLLTVPSGLCAACLEDIVMKTYDGVFKKTPPDGEMVGSYRWLDMDIAAFDGHLVIGHVCHNRTWMLAGKGERKRATIVPWFGTMPINWNRMVELGRARVRRAAELSLPPGAIMFVVLEFDLECITLKYPWRIVRALIFSIQDSPWG